MQFEFAGRLSLPDGRYLARDRDSEQRVLVVEAFTASPAPRRRRRRAKQVDTRGEPSPVPVTRVTAVRAQKPFESTGEAERWLEQTVAVEDAVDTTLAEGIALLNRALHAHSVASADPLGIELGLERALSVLLGYGSGKEVASGRFTAAHEIDPSTPTSRRRQREAELRPQERLAAALGGRERLDACETLILRARADLDAGRLREATLQLRIAVEAMLVELDGALKDPEHDEDMDQLRERRTQAGTAANAALQGQLPPEDERNVKELTTICERVLRRRRVLRG